MRVRSALSMGVALMALAACTSIIGLSDVPNPVGGGEAGASSGGASGSGSGGSSGASSGGMDSTVGDDSATGSSGGSSGAEGGSSSSGAGSSSGASSSSSSGVAGDGCSTVVENCFNGVDDNCDGLVDCADPECSGADGGTQVAECIPDPDSAIAGTLSTTASCPAGYSGTATTLNAGLNAGFCAGGTCSCSNGIVGGPATCSTSLVDKGTTVTACITAFGGTTVWTHTSADGCVGFSPLSSTNKYNLGTPTLNVTCNPSTGGTPIKNAPTWTTTDTFCTPPSAPSSDAGQGAFGAGCPSGHVCAPVAPNHCVLEPGNQVACTVTGYGVPNTTPFYSGYDDTGRTCACTCNMGLTCSGGVGMGTGSCGSLFFVGAGCQNGLTYDHVSISAPSGVNGCTPGATTSGTTSTTGFERTVCCMQ